MLDIEYVGRFRKDVKLAEKRRLDLNLMRQIIMRLAAETALPEKHRDHALTGDWRGFRECHIQPDWLLIYKISAGTLMLYRTGTHSDLFR